MAIHYPVSKGIAVPPLDGEGRPLRRGTTGGFFPNNAFKKPINIQLLNQLTQNGRNTRAILEQDAETLLAQAGDSAELRNLVRSLFPQRFDKQVGTSIAAVPSGAPGFPFDPNRGKTGDPALDAAITDTSRMVAQQLWNYRLTFNNHEQPVYELAPHAIKMLCIDDNFLNWPLAGYVIVDARMEGFERSYSGDFLHIRSDGRCEVLVEIWPTPREGMFPEEIWYIRLEAVIYDVEDLPHENMTTKAKKLYFWDKKFQLMQEQTIQWSTATGKRYISPEVPAPVAHATDQQRSMFTGEAIASILEAIGFEQYINFDLWDMGAGKINHVARADWSVWDNIQYILKQHISTDGKYDICQLNWNRGENLFEIVPYNYLYEEAGKDPNEPGDLQLEHIFFEARSMDGRDEFAKPRTSPWKAPYLNSPSVVKDIKSGDFNTILNYQFTQTSGLDSSRAYISKPVYSHWHRQKQFDCDVEENEIQNVKERQFFPHYVENLLGEYPVLVLNRTKKEEYSLEPIYSPISIINPETDRICRSRSGRGNTLLQSIFLNQTLVVRLQGSTHRIAGTFIAVDRLHEDSDTDYDWQICGQYFVAEVKHLMRFQSYVTELTLVKVHAYDKLKNTNEDIY